ncbi:protein kinase domain-containing protein [Sorangium sp. So ce1335]|uniref:protein kinase domain-containing protein n=1 Tax=Sorangium sp. So ce1335 TaxID=3133335 RepID=UPI003F610F24
MVAAGDVWEGHELLNEERGLLRHFLARQVGDTGALVWLHLLEGARLDAGLFAEEIARLQRLADEVQEVVPVLYGGVNGDVAWAASPVLDDAMPLLDATRGNDLGPADLEVLIAVGRCLVRAHELSFIHGALSPDRIFVRGDGRYAITHFGFARLFQLGPDDARHDPYGYAPPELFSGGQLGPRADVYGFGTVMYELLCKRALSPWARPPSFPSGIPPVLQAMMQRALEEDPDRRQPCIDTMLSVLIPFARAWEEHGAPPGPAHADIFAEPSGARHKPDEVAPVLVEHEASAFASGEEGGRAGELPTPRPSDVPDSVRSVPPRDTADSANDVSPVAMRCPPDTPATLRSAIPPRHARDDVTHAPAVALRSPPAPEVPDLEPMLPVPPVPSTPPHSPVLPVPPLPSSPPRSSRTPGRRSPPRWFGAVLALAFVAGSVAAVLRWEPPRHAVPRVGPAVQAAARRAIPPPSARPIERCPEPMPEASPPPVAARPRTSRPAAPTPQTRKTPAQEPDLCDGLLPCQNVFY